MLYKPNFCNSCGDAVERSSWKPWTSTRFCETCESGFRSVDWFPKIGMGLVSTLGLLGFGSFLQPAAKPLNIEKGQFAFVSANKNKAGDDTNILKSSNQTTIANSTQNIAPNINTQANENSKQSSAIALKETTQNLTEEPVYYCGAQTKKGSPCTRKVEGGRRCWQHAGQPAVLPKEKLAIRQ